MRRRLSLLLMSVTLGLVAAIAAGLSSPADDGTGRADQRAAIAGVRAAAVAFLEALDPALREQATFAMDHPERKRWSNLPATMFKREGVSFGELSPEQRRLAHRLIRSPLSSQGYLKVTGIMRLDELLREYSQATMFGHDLYWIGIFGDPAGAEPWGWQLDGHPLALNFTIVGDRIAVTPAFLGADPAEVPTGQYAGWHILGAEDQRGRDLLESLDEAQRAKAIIAAAAPRDVIAGPGRGDRLTEPEGLPASEMTAAQRELLLGLIEEYAHNLSHDLAHVQMKRIRDAGIDRLHFAWAGTEPGAPYYYRIHGPTVLIEFDNNRPAGSSSGPANHIHTVWRDAENDYGADLLRRHLLESPHHQHE
ncbi:MAG: DUF3500 domain-containing protein [Planctomycetota bacterium]|jgi:hypothetical protein